MDKITMRLLDSVYSDVKITCTKCNKTAIITFVDDFDAVEIFKSDGWYATEAKVYCPKCNKARLSKLKKNKKK